MTSSVKLPIARRPLCPQLYDGMDMQVTTCDRCSQGWSKMLGRCAIETGAEHLPIVDEIPECPIAEQCQHGIQQDGPCAVRSRGLICESALTYSGVVDAADHPLSFHAWTVA